MNAHDRQLAAADVPARPAPRPSWVIWAGLAVVLAAAAILSFDGLRGLAVTASIPEHLAWLLPIAVDAGAAVSCATWLGGRTARDAARYAGRMTVGLLVVTVLGNAGHLGMVAGHITPPWWVAVLVGAIPPAVVGTTVHLVVLLSRSPAPLPPGDQAGEVAIPPGDQAGEVALPPGDEVGDDDEPAPPDEHGTSLYWASAPAAPTPPPPALPPAPTPAGDRANELIAAGAGRRTIARELSITEHEARALLTTHRNGDHR